MKNILKTLVLALGLCFLCVSCGEKDEPDSASSNQMILLKDSMLNGIIDSFRVKSFDAKKIRCSGPGCENIGIGTISNSGSFAFSMASPGEDCLKKINMGEGFSGNISDTTALIALYALEALGSSYGLPVYELLRTNCLQVGDLQKVGTAYSILIYSNKTVSVSGNNTITEESIDEQYSIVNIQYCNFKLKKGWNELVYKTTKRIITTYSYREETSLTDTITNDLKWRLMRYPDNGYQYDQNLKSTSMHSLKTTFLFSRNILPTHLRGFSDSVPPTQN